MCFSSSTFPCFINVITLRGGLLKADVSGLVNVAACQKKTSARLTRLCLWWEKSRLRPSRKILNKSFPNEARLLRKAQFTRATHSRAFWLVVPCCHLRELSNQSLLIGLSFMNLVFSLNRLEKDDSWNPARKAHQLVLL